MKGTQHAKAVQMRKEGLSIKQIASALGVSTSTVSRWCSNIVLTSAQSAALARKRKDAGIRALRPYIEANQKLKMQDIQTQLMVGKDDLGKLSKRDVYILGLGLYWGEGYKRGSQEWGFTNSDPRIIRMIMKWAQECYDIPQDRFIARLTINALYANQNDRLIAFWSKETGIPVSQFSKTSYISGYGKPDRDASTYLGTMRIKIRKSTSLRRRIVASIAAAADQL